MSTPQYGMIAHSCRDTPRLTACLLRGGSEFSLPLGTVSMKLRRVVHLRASPPSIASLALHIHTVHAVGFAAAVLRVSEGLDVRRRISYARYTWSLLDEEQRKQLEQKMNPPARLEQLVEERLKEIILQDKYDAGHEEGLKEGLREGREEGLITGLKTSLMLIVEQRDIVVDDAHRMRIMSCEDIERLQQWMGRVIGASCLEEVFVGDV